MVFGPCVELCCLGVIAKHQRHFCSRYGSFAFKKIVLNISVLKQFTNVKFIHVYGLYKVILKIEALPSLPVS